MQRIKLAPLLGQLLRDFVEVFDRHFCVTLSQSSVVKALF
jgi:hypothetical protein